MNKIKNLFKASPIAMAVASLVIAGVASAAIVSYISNAPAAAVTVASPVDMSIYEGVFSPTNWTTGQRSITLASFGGSSMPFTTIAKNNANNRVGGYYVTVVDAGTGNLMTGKEFTSMVFNKNKVGNVQNGEMLNKLCVVKGDGTLMKLADYSAAGYSNQKLALLFDVDGASTQENNGIKESTGICSPLTLYGEGLPATWTETRSFFHLSPGVDPNEIEKWTFTPTWNTGTIGSFTIYSLYVNDLASYAKAVYGL